MAFFLRLTASLKKRLLSAYNLEKRDPIQWGITHESVALTEYCKEGDVSVLPTGNLILRNYGFCVSLNQGQCFLQITCSFIYSTVSNFTSKNVHSILFYWMFHYAPLPLQTEFKGGYYFQDVCLCICSHDFVWTYILRRLQWMDFYSYYSVLFIDMHLYNVF